MIRIAAAKNGGLTSAVLLSLALIMGFISPPVLSHRLEKQTTQTEVISKPPASPRRTVAYPFFISVLRVLFFLTCLEIAFRLAWYAAKIKIDFFENQKPKACEDRLKLELLSLALTFSKSNSSYLLRG